MTVSAVIPAHDNEGTISNAVKALLADPRVDEVVVVDDGSADATGSLAAQAGAKVHTLERNLGKGSALEIGLAAAAGDVLLMVDGDTGTSAGAALALIEPILIGEVDMAIGVLPPAGRLGGFGLVKNVAGWLIAASCGFRASAPMSGQRAFTRRLFEACRPLAKGFATDAALTTDAVRRGFRVTELAVEMTHDHRGRGFAGFSHRAGQGIDLLRAFVPRLFSRK